MTAYLPDGAWLAFADAASGFLFLNWAFQATVLLAAGLLLSRLPRLSASWRHRVLLASLVAGAVLPLLLLLPRRSLDRPAPVTLSPTANRVTSERALASIVRPRPGAERRSVLPGLPPLGLLLAAAWCLFFVGRLARVGHGLWVVRRWARRTTPVDRHLLYDACGYRVADIVVAEANGVQVPTVAGVVSPRILLPSGLSGTVPLYVLRHVLLHEEAHVRRRDPLWFFVAELAKAVVGWHPLAEPVRRAMARAAEDDCDRRVLVSGADAPDYARTLLTVLESAAPTRRLAATCPLGSPGRELRRRVAQILYGTPSSSWGAASAASVALIAVAASAQTVELGSRPVPPARRTPPARLSAPRAPVTRRPQLVAGAKQGEITRVVRVEARPLDPRAGGLPVPDLPRPESGSFEGATLAGERGRQPRAGRTVVFLLDISTSMHAYQSEARSGIIQQIEQLGPADQFNVVAFSAEVSQFAEVPVNPGEDSLAGVRAWLASLSEHSGSDLSAGLTRALQAPGITSLVIYSDGAAASGVTDPVALGELLARENVSGAQVLTVAFGEPPGEGPALLPGVAPLPVPPAAIQAEQQQNELLP